MIDADLTMMKNTTCIICRNDFAIPPWDYRYQELKRNQKTPCVCERCCVLIQKEAVIIAGITPEDLERLDRCDKVIS